MKFTPASGNITIRSRNLEDGRIVVDVIDTGAGIEPDMLPRLFTAFEQGDSAARRLGGLGLGLSISRALTEAHDGKLSAFSEGKGRGSRFTVELPTVADPDRVVFEPKSPAAQTIA